SALPPAGLSQPAPDLLKELAAYWIELSDDGDTVLLVRLEKGQWDDRNPPKARQSIRHLALFRKRSSHPAVHLFDFDEVLLLPDVVHRLDGSGREAQRALAFDLVHVGTHHHRGYE